MSTKKDSTIKKSSTKKRCSKGSRRDKTTEMCVKYANVKTFENLADQTISETKPTFSLERLDKSNMVLKYYKEGQLQHQSFVDETHLRRAKQKGQKDIKRMISLMHKVCKNPSMIQKDRGFQRLQKKLKKGGGVAQITAEPHTEVLIQTDIMTEIETPKVARLEEKMENIQENGWWEYMASNWEALATVWHLSDTVGLLDFAVTAPVNFAMPFYLDTISMSVITLMNIMRLYYPSDEMSEYSLYVQYIMYSLIGVSVFVIRGHFFYLPDSVWMTMLAAGGIATTVGEHMVLTAEKEQKTEETKRKLVDVLENP